MKEYFNPALIVLIPLAGAFMGLTKYYEFYSVLSSILTFLLLGISYGYHTTNSIISFAGLEIKFMADGLSYIFAFVSGLLWIPTVFYSIGYMNAVERHSLKRFYSAFSLAMCGAFGVAFSGNLITSFLFYEIITLSTYPLVIHSEKPESFMAGRIYLIYLVGTSVILFLPAIVLVYIYSGTTDFNSITLSEMPYNIKRLVLLLFIFGIAKQAIMPLHRWLPEAMVAPTPVSALLHAVCVVKAGVFLIIRVFMNVYGFEELKTLHVNFVPYIASFTIIYASILAIMQDDLKLRLAYSTISQLAYVLFGVSMLNEHGLKTALLQIPAHAFGKITLFFVAGSIYVSHKIKKIPELKGIGYKMPFTMSAFLIGSISMIGLPFSAGFHPKLNMYYAATGGFIIVPALSSILNAYYFLPVFFDAFRGSKSIVKEAPLIMLIPTLFTALVTLLLFFAPHIFYFT